MARILNGRFTVHLGRKKLIFSADWSGGGLLPPQTVPGLIWWLKADAGVTKDGSNKVSNWADQSGSGFDVAQNSAALQPTFTAVGQNGLPVISFDGTDGMGSATSTIMSGATANTFYIVSKANSDQDGMIICNQSSGGFFLRYRSGTQIRYNSSGSLDVSNGVAFGSYSYLTVIQRAFIGSPDTVTIRQNGGVLGTSGAMAISAADRNMRVGINADDASVTLTGAIGEIIAYTGVHTAPQIAIVETYLATRWGL